MTTATDWTFTGDNGARAARTWIRDGSDPSFITLLCHGYGEHIGRYEHVAAALAGGGAAVYGVDHAGHGTSDGERVLITDFEQVVDDVHTLTKHAKEQHPGLPVVLIGHSMGGMIAARYAQRHGDELRALVLSAPVLGRWDAATNLLAADEIPDSPIDPDTLSRDPAVGTAYMEDPLVWHGAFKRPTLEALVACLGVINHAGSIGNLPTLWIHGGADQLVPSDGTREGIEQIRGAALTEQIYPEGRHELFNETNRDQVISDMTAFITGQVS